MPPALDLTDLTDPAAAPDEELLDRAYEGDRGAFELLYLRHRDTARRVARMSCASADDADDAVAEGFTRVFAALPRLRGRQIVFRAYLLAAIRNVATDGHRKGTRIDLRDSAPEERPASEADDAALAWFERRLVEDALQALPGRWRAILWLTEVERMSPAEVSRRIGIKPNAVAALTFRSRKGFRHAYLQAHVRATTVPACRAAVERLARYVRDELDGPERAAVDGHLDACPQCRLRTEELRQVNSTLRHVLLPLSALMAQQLRDGGPVASLAHKAVAGVAAAVMAVAGVAAPRLAPSDAAPTAGHQAMAMPPPGALGHPAEGQAIPAAVPARPAPDTEAVPVQPRAPAPPAADAPPETAISGGTRSRLLPRQEEPSSPAPGPVANLPGPVPELLGALPAASLVEDLARAALETPPAVDAVLRASPPARPSSSAPWWPAGSTSGGGGPCSPPIPPSTPGCGA